MSQTKRLAQTLHQWRLVALERRLEAEKTTQRDVTVAAPVVAMDGAALALAPTADPSMAGAAVTASAAAVAGAELQEEIRKLHEQLASSKSEAWRYKRQLLKQFL
ncbi:hypothetical protein PINS_up007367 [Pythium insidiosum]|nr:hypothetical protein PINS_up007367 [Pythium insidiosum]